MSKVHSDSMDVDLSVEELREMIPQLQQLTDKYKRSERVQKTLLEIAEFSSSVNRLSQLYPAIHRSIGELMDTENFFVVFYNASEQFVDFQYFVDEFEQPSAKHSLFAEVSDSITGYILKTGNNLVFNKSTEQETFAQKGIRPLGKVPEHLMGVPLRRGNQVIGAMVVQTYNPNMEYSAEDLEVFSFVSQHIVTAVDRVKRRALTERTIRERTRQLREINDDLQEEISERQKAESLQKALFEIAELSAKVDDDMLKFYAQIHKVIARLISAPNCYIALLSEDRKHLDFPYVDDSKDDDITRRPLGLGLTEYVLRTRQAQLITPANVLSMAEGGDLNVDTAQRMLNRSNTWLGCPLFVNDEIAGVIAIQSYGMQANYTAKDLELLKFVSQHVASAMERKKRSEAIMQHNTQLEERVEQRTQELNKANEDLKRQIEERKEIELKLIHDAHHDSLTGLPNRALFNSQLELAVASKKRHPESMYAVLFIDLDRFKSINDTLGHQAGDELLKEVSKRLGKCIRGHDLLARLGGDEFVVLLDHFEDHEVVESVASRIIDSVSEPYFIAKKDIYSRASIGIALLENYYTSPEEVLRDADAAMYQAKAAGRGCYVMFDQSMRERLLEEMEMETLLRETLRDNAFNQFVQPVKTIENDTIHYNEMYLQWESTNNEILDRNQFRQVAEQSGLTVELDLYQVRSACRYLQTQSGSEAIAINISINVLLQNKLVSQILAIIKESGVEAEKLIFEFDENELNRRSHFILPTIKKLKRAGIRLVLDHFGSGLASLSYLYSYPFDYLKVDKRFTNSLPRSRRNLKLIESVMLISEHLQFEIIADGISSQAQMDALQEIGCKYYQGKLIAEAVPIDLSED